MFMQGSVWGIACCVLAIVGVAPARGAEDQLPIQVKAIFSEGGLPGEATLKTANTHFDKAKAAAPKDVRPALALSLVYIYHEELNKAGEVLEEAAKDHLDDPRLLRILLWLRAKRGEPAEVGKLLSAAANRLQKAAGSGEPTPADLESAKFLGQLVGYCAGPGGPQFRAAKLDQLEKSLADGLSAPLKAAFSQGREEITKKFNGMQDGSLLVPEMFAEGDIFNRPLKAEEPEELRGKNSADRSLVERQFGAANVEYQRVIQMMNVARQRFSAAEQNMNAKLAAAKNEKNPRTSASFKSDAQVFYEEARKEKLEYLKLLLDRKRLNKDGLELRKKYLVLVDKELAEFRKAEEKAQKEKQEKDNPKESKGKDADKGKGSTDKGADGGKTAEDKPKPRPHSLKADPTRLAAIETYIPLDLDAERKQILSTFVKP